MAIALKDWDQSVELVLKGKSSTLALAPAYPSFSSRVPLERGGKILTGPFHRCTSRRPDS